LKPSSDAAAPLETGAVKALVYAAEQPAASLILAHGAGAGQRSPFISSFARAIAGLGVDVVTFDFPYMTLRRRVPDRGDVLEGCYREVIEHVRETVESARRRLFIGGKSMGGRIATQVAASDPDLPVAGLVLLGYPLHPPGRPTQLRSAHLPAVHRPMLFVQGSRDVFGSSTELEPILRDLSPAPTLHVVDRADHSLTIPRRDAHEQAVVHHQVQRFVAGWIASIGNSA
jgi:predicted alpha/beta-hydrolase family hydrolase